MSNVSSAPRWTPPMPPVAKISMPASSAMNMVAATVVPAEPRRAATAARSRREALTTPPESWARPSISLRSRPTRNRPSMTAIVAGAAPERPHRLLDRPRRLDIARIGHAVGDDGRFERDQRPPLARASATSGEKSIRSATLMRTCSVRLRLSGIAGRGINAERGAVPRARLAPVGIRRTGLELLRRMG